MCRCSEEEPLTPQLLRVACLLVLGRKPGAIATELNLKPQTVKNYMQEIGRRLGANSGSMYTLAKILIERGYRVDESGSRKKQSGVGWMPNADQEEISKEGRKRLRQMAEATASK